jgi:hypothetical protein
MFYPYIVGIAGNEMTLAPALPWSVGGGIDENTYFGVENTVTLWRQGEGNVPPYGFYSDGGVLAMYQPNGYPSGPGAPGSVWNNGLVIGVTPGITPNPSAPAVYFGQISPAGLLALGGGNLPLLPPTMGSKQLWNSGREVLIA